MRLELTSETLLKRTTSRCPSCREPVPAEVIRVAQGESRRFSDNQLLGELELPGLRPAARGEVSIAVTFELEADGTLRARAKDIESHQSSLEDAFVALTDHARSPQDLAPTGL